MSLKNDYDRLDALGLAELVRRREVTPSELLDVARAALLREERHRAPSGQPIQESFALGRVESSEIIKEPNDVGIRDALQPRES